MRATKRTIAALLCTLLLAAQAVAQQSAAVQTIKKARPSVVGITTPDAKQPYTATGMIFHVQGKSAWVLTNRHVVVGCELVTVTAEGTAKYAARVVCADAKVDLAVLKVEAGKTLAAYPLADLDEVEVGVDVIAIGYPYGQRLAATKGIISVLGVELSWSSATFKNLVQFDAPICPGNSGGPLLTVSGRWIGVVAAVHWTEYGQAPGMNYAIPSEVAVAFLKANKLPFWQQK